MHAPFGRVRNQSLLPVVSVASIVRVKPFEPRLLISAGTAPGNDIQITMDDLLRASSSINRSDLFVVSSTSGINPSRINEFA